MEEKDTHTLEKKKKQNKIIVAIDHYVNNYIISKNKTLKPNNLIRKKERKNLLARSPQIIESHQRLVFEYNDITFYAGKHTQTHTQTQTHI